MHRGWQLHVRLLLIASLAAAAAGIAAPGAAAPLVATSDPPAFEPIGKARALTHSPAGLQARQLALSRHARYLAYVRTVEIEGGGHTHHAFLRERGSRDERQIAVPIDGEDQPAMWIGGVAISRNARFVVFHSAASNLVPGDVDLSDDVFLWDAQTGSTTLVSVGPHGEQPLGDSFCEGISRNGKYVVFTAPGSLLPEDVNLYKDVYRYSVETGDLDLASAGNDGWSGHGSARSASISGDGNLVAFQSFASDLETGDPADVGNGIYLRDMNAGSTRLLTHDVDGGPTDSWSTLPSLSRTGHHLAFISYATDLTEDAVAYTPQVYWLDTRTGATQIVTRAYDGSPANRGTDDRPVISGNGRFVALRSVARNLVPYETHFYEDIFLHDTSYRTTYLVSHGMDGSVVRPQYGPRGSYEPSIGASSRYVGFSSPGTNVAPRDGPGDDIFLYKITKVGLR